MTVKNATFHDAAPGISTTERATEYHQVFWHNSRDVGERESSFEVVPDGYAEIFFI